VYVYIHKTNQTSITHIVNVVRSFVRIINSHLEKNYVENLYMYVWMHAHVSLKHKHTETRNQRKNKSVKYIANVENRECYMKQHYDKTSRSTTATTVTILLLLLPYNL
jgi:predicted RNA-binding protein with RPS1 domain